MALTLPRQNYHIESEATINRQINYELHASYIFLSMAAHFDRDDVSLPAFAKYFRKMSEDERKDAVALMCLQNRRGGRVVLQSIDKPDTDEWGSGLRAMEKTLQVHRQMNELLLDAHAVADRHADAELKYIIKHDYLKKQVDVIKEVSDYVAVLKRVGPGLGEYLFDKNTLE